MRKETIVKTYLQFNELNEQQQAKVLDDFRQDGPLFEWHDDALVNHVELLELLGFNNVEINFTGFWSQGDGASFTASYSFPENAKERNERLKAVKEKHLEFLLEDSDLKALFKTIPTLKNIDEDDYCIDELSKIYRTNGHYYHDCTIFSDCDELQEFSRTVSRDIYKMLEDQYNYYTSNEYIEELININNYEFDSETLRIA